jgi:cell division protein FtsI (penicillin-binding protein 3)
MKHQTAFEKFCRNLWHNGRSWQLTVCPRNDTHRGRGINVHGADTLGLGQRIVQGRLRLLSIGCLAAFFLIALRLVDLMVFNKTDDAEVAAVAAPVQQRGEILDRNGLVLATNLETSSLYANPKHIHNVDTMVAKLAAVLPQMKPETIKHRLKDGKGFVWVARHLTPQEIYAVNKLGLPGLYFQADARRTYPFANDTAHLIGMTDIDNQGVAGAERSLNKSLAAGQNAQLSVDIRLQHVVRDELVKAVQAYNALGGTGLVMDVHSGEVISMVSLPDYDPNNGGEALPTNGTASPLSPRENLKEALFNRATLGVYEMGSTFKLFTLASGLDTGQFKLSDTVDASESMRFGRFTISDFHGKHRWLSLPEVLMYSSNIGAARIAMAVGRDNQKQFFKNLGFLEKPKLELSEVGQPMFPKDWRDLNMVTASYGHGIAVSPLQLVSGVSALVNGGSYHPPTLLKTAEGQEIPEHQIVSAQTSAAMRKMMYAVVTDGTGQRAKVTGIPIGGKTGTAEKSHGGGYAAQAVLASFVAAFPINDPRYAVLVMIDEPKAQEGLRDTPTGGLAAAPVVHNIVRRAAPLLNLMPVDENDPSIQTALTLPTNTIPEHNGYADANPPSNASPKAQLATFNPADDR